MVKHQLLHSLQCVFVLLCFYSGILHAHQPGTLPINAEERRLINTANQPSHNTQIDQTSVQVLTAHFASASSFNTLKTLVIESGSALWNESINHQNLYWDRLAGRILIKQQKANFTLSPEQRRELLAFYELGSRGMLKASFPNTDSTNLLLIELDPTPPDRNLKGNRMSSSVILNFDEHHWQSNEQAFHSQTVLAPNRFRDFDNGLIEGLLTPLLQNQALQAIVILSTGNQSKLIFQRYAGRNRSTPIPDNTNTMTSAKPSRPSPPRLQGKSLTGPEFLSCSEPGASFFTENQAWPVFNNRTISTLTGTKTIERVDEILGEVSVTGSSGGYLPNELTYRALLLKQQLNSPVKVFHLQLPQLTGQNDNPAERILNLEQALSALISYSVPESVND